jgi:DHA1 family tetracycline resistance protein-like MFS transporter
MRLLPLLLTIFIDSLGFGLAFPILSTLIMEEGGILPPEVSLATRGFIFGCLVSSFCLGQFFGGPILGALSDQKGRRRVLLATLWLAVFCYVVAALSIQWKSLSLLFLSRLSAGVSGGNYAIAQSIVVDCSSDAEKAKNFGLLGMAWGGGFIIGPFLGGKLSDPSLLPWFDLSFPFWFAALLCACNIALVLWKVEETLASVRKVKWSVWMGVNHLKAAFQHPVLRGLFAVMFIFSLGWGFFIEFCPLFLLRHLHCRLGEIANFYAYVGIWIALCQGLFIRPFLKRFAPYRLLSLALVGVGTTLSLLLLIDDLQMLMVVIPFVAFADSLIFPTSSAIISNLSPKEAQGEILGINTSLQWAAIGICPLFSGSLVALYPHLPIGVASVCMIIAFGVLWWVMRKRGPVTEFRP